MAESSSTTSRRGTKRTLDTLSDEDNYHTVSDTDTDHQRVDHLHVGFRDPCLPHSAHPYADNSYLNKRPFKHDNKYTYYENGNVYYMRQNGVDIYYHPNNQLMFIGKVSEYSGFAEEGISYWITGATEYEGTFEDGQRSGKGTLYRINGTKEYEGKFVNGKAHGVGTLYKPDGSVEYFGEFKDGQANGKGYEFHRLTDTSNTTYIDTQRIKRRGEFKNGLVNGIGVQYAPNGTKEYKGEFKDGKKCE